MSAKGAAPKTAAKGKGKGGSVNTDKIEDPGERVEMVIKQRECDVAAQAVAMYMRSVYSKAMCIEQAATEVEVEGLKFEDLHDEVEPCSALIKNLKGLPKEIEDLMKNMEKAAQGVKDPSDLDADMFEQYSPNDQADQVNGYKDEFEEILSNFTNGCMEAVGDKFPDSQETAQGKLDELCNEMTTTIDSSIEDMMNELNEEMAQMQTSIQEATEQIQQAFDKAKSELDEDDEDGQAKLEMDYKMQMVDLDCNVKMSELSLATTQDEAHIYAWSQISAGTFMLYLEMRKLVEKVDSDEAFTGALENFPEMPKAKAAAKATKTPAKKTRSLMAQNRMPGDTADLDVGGCGGGNCTVQ